MCRPMTSREEEQRRHKALIERFGANSDQWRSHMKLHRENARETPGSDAFRIQKQAKGTK